MASFTLPQLDEGRQRAAEREAERLDFLKLQARLATERPGARWTPAQTTVAAGFPLLCIARLSSAAPSLSRREAPAVAAPPSPAPPPADAPPPCCFCMGRAAASSASLRALHAMRRASSSSFVTMRFAGSHHVATTAREGLTRANDPDLLTRRRSRGGIVLLEKDQQNPISSLNW